MENETKLLKAKKKLEALLLEGIRSGPATPMTKKDWTDLRRAVHDRAKARNRRGQERDRVKNLLLKSVVSGNPITINKKYWQRKQRNLAARADVPKALRILKRAGANNPPMAGDEL